MLPAAAAKPSPGASTSTSKPPQHQSVGRQPGSGSGGTGNAGNSTTSGPGTGLDPVDDPASACTSPPTTGSETDATPWPQNRLNFRSAWTISNGAGVRVAVIDSGVDNSQPQMARIHYAFPHNVVTGSSDVQDCVSHGTGVTGIIAAPPDPDTYFVGVAPGVTIIPIRQTTSDGKGSSIGIAAGIDWAVAHHAQVVNISTGTTTASPQIEAAVQRADKKHVILVCAAGNDGAQQGVKAVEYPAEYAAKYDNVIAVAAVNDADVLTNFSEKGGYTTLSAPGVGVTMPALRSGYRTDDGTSFAAPFVTGTVALMLGADGSLSPRDVKARLDATADPPPKTAPDPQYGWGIVNPYRAVTAVSAPSATEAPQSQQPLPPLAAPIPPDRSTQHVALGLSAAFVVLAGFLIGGWALARRRRAALHGLRSLNAG